MLNEIVLIYDKRLSRIKNYMELTNTDLDLIIAQLTIYKKQDWRGQESILLKYSVS